MEVAIDRAGRFVIPKPLRDELGLRPGMPLLLTTDGVGLRVEPMPNGGRLVDRGGRLVVVASSGRPVADDEIREALDAGRR